MKDPNQIESIHPLTGRVHVETRNDEPSMTQQQYKDDCDINNIMKKYASTGQFTHLTSKEGRYQDFSMITDYQSMVETVQYAKEAFASLPAEVRTRFRNDPGQLLDFLQDKKNHGEAVKLGLIDAKEPTITQPQSPNANPNATPQSPPQPPQAPPASPKS